MKPSVFRKIISILILTTYIAIGLQFVTLWLRIGYGSPPNFAIQTPRTAAIPSISPKNFSWGVPSEDMSFSSVAYGNAYFVAGASFINNLTDFDLFLAKFDISGELLFLKWWGGTGPDAAYGVTVDGSGNLYVVGSTLSYGLTNSRALIIKYSPVGVLLWNITWGGGNGDYLEDVFASPDGTIYAVGTSGIVSQNAIIIKLNTQGDILWNRTVGGAGVDNGNAVISDKERNIYMTGFTTSWGAGFKDVFFNKYDKNGVLLFNRTWGGPFEDRAYGITIDGGGELTITGHTSSWTSGASINTILLHYDASGNLEWNQSWGGLGFDIGRKSIVETDGSFLMTGFTESSGGLGRNVLLASFSGTGQLQWNTTWSGTGLSDEEGTAILRIGNQILITGTMEETMFPDLLVLIYDIPLPLEAFAPLWISLGIIAAIITTLFILIWKKRGRERKRV